MKAYVVVTYGGHDTDAEVYLSREAAAANSGLELEDIDAAEHHGRIDLEDTVVYVTEVIE